jgi:hypothetical protein
VSFLLKTLLQGAKTVLQLTDDVTQTIAQDLENVLQNIYDDLGSISASTFSSNAYMDVLMKSQGYSEADRSMNGEQQAQKEVSS